MKGDRLLEHIQTDRRWESTQIVSPTMAIHALLVLLFTWMVGAVDVFGSDAALSKQATQLTLVWESPQGTLTPLVEPLTAQAGRGGSIRASVRITPL